MVALGTLSMLTMFSVRGGIQTSANDRFHSIAQYAAESGGAAAMTYLRNSIDPTTFWTNSLQSSSWTTITGNNIAVGASGNPFTNDVLAYYTVEIYNNRSDIGGLNTDTDSRVVIRSTGYGPDGAISTIEWDVAASGGTVQRPCSTYGQKGQSEDNSGRGDCLGTVNSAVTGTY